MARQTDEPEAPEEKKGFAENFADFMKFVYNPSEGTVLGRGGKSWGRLVVFYTFYYAFLALLLWASLTICYNCLDHEKPYFQTRLENPGVTIQPKLYSKISLEKDIHYSVSDPSSYEKYTGQLTDFLEPYNASLQTSDEEWMDCDNMLARDYDSEWSEDHPDKVCRISTEDLGACGKGDYGYGEGKPCVLVKLNRVIDWTPVGYFHNIEAAADFQWSKAPALSDVLLGGESQQNDLLYVSCYGLKEEDQVALNGEGEDQVSEHTHYQPAGLGMGFYPYKGKAIQPHYLSPVVGVQFTNVQRGVEINVGCKVYAQNINENDKLESGYFHFHLQVDD